MARVVRERGGGIERGSSKQRADGRNCFLEETGDRKQETGTAHR
jgi:hypothetical protein